MRLLGSAANTHATLSEMFNFPFLYFVLLIKMVLTILKNGLKLSIFFRLIRELKFAIISFQDLNFNALFDKIFSNSVQNKQKPMPVMRTNSANRRLRSLLYCQTSKNNNLKPRCFLSCYASKRRYSFISTMQFFS